MSIRNLTKENIEKIKRQEQPIIIDFHASWCAPCKQLSPIFKELSNEITIDFYEIDIDKEQELAQHFNIMSVPTIIILKKGQEMLRINGVQSKDILKNKILPEIQ